MAVEPGSSSAGISLTVIAIGIIGPIMGPYFVICSSALAGAFWPLSVARTDLRSGAWLLFRCTLTAIVLTPLVSLMVERIWGVSLTETLGPVAMAIGALGNGWRPVFGLLEELIKSFLSGVLRVKREGEQ